MGSRQVNDDIEQGVFALITTQSGRRKLCGGLLVVLVVMSVLGANSSGLRDHPIMFLIYWGAIFLLLVWVLLLVAIDLLTIRLKYVVKRRQLFRQTFIDDKLMHRLCEEAEAAAQNEPPDTPATND